MSVVRTASTSPVLSLADIERYHRDGYLVVEQVVPDEQVAALREVADGWVEAAREVKVNGDLFDLEPGHSSARPQVRRIKNPTGASQVYESVMTSAPVLDRVEQLIGPNIRYQGTKLNMKSAGIGSPVEWHQDWAFYPHTNDDVLAVGVVIDDMTIDNGCLFVLPGSHKGTVFDHHVNGTFVGSVDPGLVDAASCVPLEASAGSITIHHARLLHGSAPNTSGKPRRLFLIEYISGDAWPLVGMTWQDLESRRLRGVTSAAPRMEAIPVRIPLPVPEQSGSIYELQATEPERTSFSARARSDG
jgi:phytanoyl-CoA hydroxylase